VSWINKYLPLEKSKKKGTGLDSSKLKKLAESSPMNILNRASRANSIASSDNGSTNAAENPQRPSEHVAIVFKQ